MKNNNESTSGIAGARTSHFTIKYKAYGDQPPPPSVKKRPSQHIREALDPPLAQRDGVIRPKPCIVNKHNFAEQRHQIVSSVPEDEPLFQPFPPEVVFTGYHAFKKYATVLQLRNNDKVVRRVQLLSEDPLLTVELLQSGDQAVYSEIGSSKVACGMEVSYTIAFVPESDGDYMSELLAVTDREKFVIPVRCVGLKPMVDVPDEIIFPPTPAKCSYKKNVMIHNVGKKKAVFRLRTSEFFRVSPPTHNLDPGEFFQCCVYFFPRRVCTYEGELEITFKENGDQLVSRLIGAGTELNVGLSTGVIAASTTYIRRTSHVTFQVFNNSSSLAYFLWPKFASKEELDEYVQQVGDYARDLPPPDALVTSEEDELLSSSIDKAFTITPAKGEVWPGTLVEITVTFCPPKPLRYLSTTYCLISGKSDAVPLQLQGLGVGPLAQFSPCELDLGELCLYSVNKFSVALENLGELDAHFRLMEALSSPMITFTFEPDTGTVEPNDFLAITVKVCGSLMGTFSEKFLWEVTDSIHTLSLAFRGSIIRPSFSVDTTELDFGPLSYGLLSVSSGFYNLREKKIVSIELVPWEERRYATVISLDIPKVGKDFATIPVQARCLVPTVTISCDCLDYGTCFLRYGYTKTLSLINDSLVPARYEIQAQEKETENLAILRLKAESGFIEAGSSLPLEFTLSTVALGDVSLSAIVSISGKEYTHYLIKVLATSVGPIIKIEKPISKKLHSARQQTEEADTEWVPALDFGKVQVLRDHHLSVVLRNACCIRAPLKISLGKKDSMYHLNLSDVPLDPFEAVELKVRAYMDDAGKFNDKVTILFEGGELFIPLSAVGVGSTLVCKEFQEGFVHFGDQFTLRHFSYTIEVQNMGRKPQTLAWDNDTTRKQRAINKSLAMEAADQKKSGNKKTALVVPEPVPVFTITPDKTVIKQYSPFSLTVSGYTTNPGHIQEDFTCKVTSAKDMYYLKISVDADMAALTLVFSETTLKFVQNNGWGKDGPHELSRTLTCENVSKLPLTFSLAVKPPFSINQAEWTLRAGGSGSVVVSLEKQDIAERHSTVLYGKLDILYTGTLERNGIDLIAHINYPNLSVNQSSLDFGCILELTYKRMHIELKNSSALDVWYSWMLDDGYGDGIHVSQNILQDSGGLKIPTNYIFDILPVRGYLEPGEQETVEVSYYGHCGYQCQVSAICEVKGGPDYIVALSAESGTIAHALSRVALDYNVQPFNKASTKEFTLSNPGKVPFKFEIDLGVLKGDVLREVTPMTGLLGPGTEQKFAASVYPGLPEKFMDSFTIQVAHFVPTTISILGSGAFPHILLDTTRVRSHKYLSLAAEAFHNAYMAMKTTPVVSARSNSVRMSTTAINDHQGPPLVEAQHPGGEQVSVVREVGTAPTTTGTVGDEWVLETTGNEVLSFGSEVLRAPSIDQVDSEIDRLLFKEHLIHENKETLDIHKFVLNTHICDFENVTLGETTQKTVKATNDGPLPVTFKINMASVKAKGITLDPDRLITLPPDSPKSSMDLVFKMRTDLPRFPAGPLECSVPLFIKEGPQLVLAFTAHVSKPVLEVSHEHLDFGAVQFGQCKILYLRLFSRGEVPCIWTAAKPDLGSCDIHDSTAFTCEPETGVIEAHKYVDLKVQFIPTQKKKAYFAVFFIDLLHNPVELKFACRGHSYVPIFTLEPSIIQLGPILPNAPEAAEIKYVIYNNAEEPVELYSLAFDPDYVKEEEILKTVEGYNEHDQLFLERRSAGQPFWSHLKPGGSAKQEALQQPPTQPSPLEAAGKAGKSPSGSAPDVSEKPLVSHAKKLLIMLLGPPAVGKSTQAKQLSRRFSCPVVAMDDMVALTCTNRMSSTADGSSGTQASGSSTASVEINDFEKDLIATLRRKLESSECIYGAVFDGLNSHYATTVSLAKCILYAAGLEPYDPENPQDDGKKKGGGEKKKAPAPPKGKKAEEEPTGPPIFPKTFWKGEATVYAITLKAQRSELSRHYQTVPDRDQCKKKVYVETAAKESQETEPAGEPPPPPASEPETPTLASEVLNHVKYYPYVSLFPSEEELDKYYASETDVQNLLGGAKAESHEEGAGTNRVACVAINALQNVGLVYEEELHFLPDMENVAPLPPAEVLQVVKRPHRRSSFISDPSSLKFAFFTSMVGEEEDSSGDPTAQGKKIKGGAEKAAGLQSEKYQIMLKRKTEYFTPLEALPEGHEMRTRWVVKPQQRVELLLRFWSQTVGEFEQKFVFEGLNGNHQARLMCKGVCAEPQIGCFYRHVKLPNTKVTPTQKLQKALFVSDRILDFGPLPTGRTADGFPNLPDSEHCKRLEIRNIGLFDLHVDFDVGEGSEAPGAGGAAGKKPAAKGGKPLFMLNPLGMDLKINDKQMLSIYCYPPQGQLGPLEGRMVCRIRDNPQPLECKVICLADTPRVDVDCKDLVFERLLLDREVKKSIIIRHAAILCFPLLTLLFATVEVTFKAIQEKVFSQKLKLQVFEAKDAVKFNQELPLSITAEAYKIDIAIKYPSPPEDMPPDGGFNYGTLRVAQDSLKSLTMDNKGKYKVDFKFVHKTALTQELFTITPPGGTLEPKKQQKVDLHFNKEKTLQREVALKGSRDVELHLIECLTGKTEQIIPSVVTVHAVHSKFQLLPAQGIHFGSQICGNPPPPRLLKIVNLGKFDFAYKLVSTLAPPAPEAAAAADKGKKTDKKGGGGGASGEPLELNSFTVVPASGTVLPGSHMELSVFFKVDTPCLTSETFHIEIADMNPFLYPGGVAYELSGEACIPGISTEPRTIFYEYHVVDEIDLLAPIPSFGTYSRKDEMFSFGPVIINHEKAALDASAGGNKDKPAVVAAHKKGARDVCMTARLRIENPLRVPCSVELVLRRPGEAAAKSGGKEKLPVKGGGDNLLCMELSPLTADIPPLEYQFVTISFKPLALQKYTGLLEVLVKGRESPQFTCHIQGEGTLPHLFAESPSAVSPLGFPWLDFPRLLVGKSHTLPIVLVNNGLVPAVARLELAGDASDGLESWLHMSQVTEQGAVPLLVGKKLTFPVGCVETASVTFTPRAARQYKQDIMVVVDDNPFDAVTISITGEGYSEEVVCLGLPKALDDAICFDDCGVGGSTHVIFTLKNASPLKHWRFGWSDAPAFVSFRPALGHLHAGASKQITATFSPTEAVEYMDKDIYLQLCNIVYTGQGGEEEEPPPDWDDTMLPPPNEDAPPEGGKGKGGKAAPPPAAAAKGGKGGNAGAAPELTIDSNINPAEPALEVVKGSAKLVAYKLHAVADNARYECSVQAVQFKTTMMFQVRTYPLVVKSLSKASMPFSWRVEKADGSVEAEEQSMYAVEPACGVLRPGLDAHFVLKFCPLEVHECSRVVACHIPTLEQPLRLPVCGSVTRPWCHFELPRSDYASRRDGHFPGPDGELGPLDAGIHIIEFDSLGCNMRNVKYFTAVNPTNVAYKFVWEEKKSQSLRWTAYDLEPITDDDVFPRPFRCMMRRGLIPGGKRFEMGFEYTPMRLELHESFWTLRIPDKRIEVNFLLVGNVKKPELSLSCSHVDFGQVLVKARVKQTIYLHNPEPGPFAFNFDKLSYSPSQPGQVAVLTFTPSSGIVAQGATIPVELLFSPALEGDHSFDIVCNLRMASPLFMSVKAEAYLYHEKLYLEGGDDGRPLALVAKEAFRLDYGRVMINSRVYRKFILTNSGKAAFHFMWGCGSDSALLRAEPVAELVAKDEQLTCDLLFHPTAERTIVDLPIVCQIMHGNKYLIHLNATCYRPRIKFSFHDFDFGARFLHQPGLTPPSTDLTLSNEGDEVITCELLYENTSFLEVEYVNMSLSPGQNHTIRVTFKPDAFVLYREAVKFQICGLDTVTISVRGEGVPVLLELVDPRQRYLSFGVVRLGKTAKQHVQITNKSKILAPISFEPSADALGKLGITCLPAQGIQLPSRYTRPMELVFTPQARMTKFTEGLVLEVAGTKSRVLTVSGICHAVVVKLNQSVLPFDIVTLGSKVTKKIQLENHGDLATNFAWDTTKCEADFTIFPMEGFLTPRQVSKLDVTFHPSAANPDMRIEDIPCQVEGGEPLHLTLLGGCVEQGAPAETLKFMAAVRATESKMIQLKNPTTQNWLVHPAISHPYWSGAVTVQVPANQSIGYSLTYCPLTMSNTHLATISFPLPFGGLVSYQLSGEAGPPPPEASIKLDAKARLTLPFSLHVPNWLKATQQFVVMVSMVRGDATTVIKGPKTIDVPGLSNKECVFYFKAHKPGSTMSTVTFKNEESGEYSLFNVTVETGRADIVESVLLECFVRQQASRTLRLRNPLDRPVVFKTSCTGQGVVLPAQVQADAMSSAAVDVAFRPLVQGSSQCSLSLHSDDLGEFEYQLTLKSVAAPSEAPLLFSVPLGNQLVQTFHFRHTLPVKATYNCLLSQAAIDGGFTAEPSMVQANPAPPDGLDLQVQVVFEPSRIMDEFQGLLTLKSPEGSDFCCQLLASCSSPSPQGPFFIKGSGQINFKNVYNDTVQFNYTTDNPAFVVSKGEKMQPKKQSKLVVSYKPEAPNAPKTGRLTVTCNETDDVWSWMWHLKSFLDFILGFVVEADLIDQLSAERFQVDGIPLSRPKRNIARDFSDGVLAAEVVAHYCPRLVDIHNYSAANSLAQKIYNWNTLNNKVFRRLNFSLTKEDVEAVANAENQMIERILKLLKYKIAKYRPIKTESMKHEPNGHGNYPIKRPPPRMFTPPSRGHERGLSGSPKRTDSPERQERDGMNESQKDIQLRELRETIELLEAKVMKLEQLVSLKDHKIQVLTGKPTRP
ncbi:hypothetical protein SELMODRAFT_425615 [Selaginella moellendorffii]|uniref:Calponin-homology (CH) domain-containing protein n=1 Tax=Selaginella moellendorffii TaxID=88036 RepID=D8STP3_SELML|nr:hypothetical protein SELMODRAFT_425615 [Selaginella moellendorffii]